MSAARAFISYRRADSGPYAQRLAETIGRNYGAHSVFLDTEGIRISDNWSKTIEAALEEASVFILVIGPQWLSVQDEAFRRRIDNQDDWVRQEAITALRRGIKIIPVFVAGADVFPKGALPDALSGLASIQGYKIDANFWDRDIFLILSQLGSAGFKAMDADLIYPAALDRTPALSGDELKAELKSLKEWDLRQSHDSKGKPREELSRTFRFRSFRDAIHFMMVASRFINKTDHHPDWRNLWVNVEVRLTTWDIGNRPTIKDVRLAKHLEELYVSYR